MNAKNQSTPLHIAIAFSHAYATGGIQRLAYELANWLSARGHLVTLITRKPLISHKKQIIELNREISSLHYDFDSPDIISQYLIKNQIDCCIAMYSYAEVFFWIKALNQAGIPLLYSEHSSSDIVESVWWNRIERQTILAAADQIHLLLEQYILSLSGSFRDKARSIPNPISFPITKIDRSERKSYLLLSLGRLEKKSKQLHVLINAFSIISDQFPNWRLEIWGDGSDLKRLKGLLKDSTNKRITLEGETYCAEKQYERADLFCISSQYEGFPLSVTEAMTHGLPVVGFAGCPGVNTIVQHEINGLLAPEMTAVSLAAELSKLMGDHELRNQMSEEAYRRAADFDKEKIMLQWEEMILECSQSKGKTALQKLLSTYDNPDDPSTHAHVAWLQSASAEERLKYSGDSLLQYVNLYRNHWRIKLPWKIVLSLWKFKSGLKGLFQQKRKK